MACLECCPVDGCVLCCVLPHQVQCSVVWDGMGWDGMGWDGMGKKYGKLVVGALCMLEHDIIAAAISAGPKN